MSRISRHQMFMEIAHIVAKRSTCMRLNVGAIMVIDRSIVSVGYNGSPPGAKHCQGNSCPGKHFCQETIHAEINALDRISSMDIGIDNRADMYVTDSPCPNCFDQITASGYVGRIFFDRPYRLNDHLVDTLWDVEIFRVLPAGYVIDWQTQELVDVST